MGEFSYVPAGQVSVGDSQNLFTGRRWPRLYGAGSMANHWSSGSGSTNVNDSILAIEELETAPLAKGKWHCGATNWPDSSTARERLFGVIDRRGVSTTGGGVGAERTGLRCILSDRSVYSRCLVYGRVEFLCVSPIS